MKNTVAMRTALLTPWAILPEALEAIMGFLDGEPLAVAPDGARPAAASPMTGLANRIRAHPLVGLYDRHALAPYGAGHALAPEGARNGSSFSKIAVLQVLGTITQRPDLLSFLFGGTSTELLARDFRRAQRAPDISAIVLDIDSPGGTVDGVEELATEIYRARGKKPVIAVANTLAASAAYWIAAAADEVVASPSSELGAIGVLAAHADISGALEREGIKVTLVTAGRYKAEGNPYERLGESARANLQKRVDEAYRMFTGSVARSRGATVEQVQKEFGEGRLVSATDAVRFGMADRVATLQETLISLGAIAGPGAGVRAGDFSSSSSMPPPPCTIRCMAPPRDSLVEAAAMRLRRLRLHESS